MAWSANPFPPEALPGVSVGGNLPAGYETSGVVWHSRVQKLFLVSDGGTVSSMNADGTGVTNWSVGGDLEGITVARPQSDLVYLGVEHPDSIREFNIATGQVTRTFDLTPWMTGPDNSGLEALTFVPDAGNPEGGLFYAGLQATGQIFAFQLPILSSTTSTAVTHVRTIPALDGVSDISDMYYQAGQGVLYAIYDTANLLRAMTPDGTLVKEWSIPGSDQEGLALQGSDLYIGEDYGTGGNVLRYSNFVGVPEPASLAVLALGGVAILRRRQG
ncbi:MAG: esterase-like activity of phytase family protein [Planctomycetota bacterium]|nr:esterase-like activity of phytase family protein [Planctomycetota bacterium]